MAESEPEGSREEAGRKPGGEGRDGAKEAKGQSGETALPIAEREGGNAKRNMAYSEHARMARNYEPLTGAMETGGPVLHRGKPLR